MPRGWCARRMMPLIHIQCIHVNLRPSAPKCNPSLQGGGHREVRSSPVTALSDFTSRSFTVHGGGWKRIHNTAADARPEVKSSGTAPL
jgi:hypothetical protein